MASETMRITEELIVEDKTGPGLNSAEQKVSAFDKTLQNTQTRLKNMTGSRWDMTVNAVDKATTIITNVEGKIRGAVGKAWNFTVGLIDKVTAPLQSVFRLLSNPILQAGAVLGISLSVSDAISTFGGFEGTMSKVKAISGATGEDFEALTNLAKEMGATTKFTAEEAAQGLTYMAMAGWKTEDMLTSLSGVMNLAAASGEDLATVSDIVTDAMTAFGLAADGVTASGVSNAMHFSDVLAAASSNANTTVAGMGETFKYVGSMAGAMGYSIEDVALATGLMANSGIKGTMAGTALNSMLSRLSTNTSGAADAISALGVEFYNADGSARNLGDVMGELRRATVNMTAAQKSELANTVAGMEAQKGLLAILNTSEEDYNKLAEAIYNADGAAQQMSDTMLDNMQGSMTLLQSAVDGVKLSLGSRLSPYVRQFADWLTTKMPAVEGVINDVMDTIDEKIAGLKSTIEEFTSSEEWANADVWGKISIAWDKIVAEPFSAWWEGTGRPWLTEKVAGFGETLGSGITQGLLAILGFDASGALEDGKTIGGKFIEGFKAGFDTEQIGAALTEWAQDHKGIIAAAGAIAGAKFVGKFAQLIQGGVKGFRWAQNLFGGNGSKAAGTGTGALEALRTYTTNTMTVTAGTVVVNGSRVVDTGRVVEKAAETAGHFITAGAGAAAGTAAGAAITAGTAGTTAAIGAGETAGALLLTGEVAGGTAAGSAAAAATGGVIESVELASGAWVPVSGAVQGGLASVGTALGSTATTAAGAAAAGAAGTGGIIGGVLGLLSAGIDVFQGIGKSKEGDTKGAKDEYVTAGTKGGMVAAGAGIGAAIGSVVPGLGTAIGALVGAGVGGISALLGGDAAGKAISDSTDEGGWLNTAGKDIGHFFSETLPAFVTETIPATASTVGTAIGEFATKVGTAVGGFFTETVPEFFTQTIPNAAKRAATSVGEFATKVGNRIGEFFTEDIPTFLTETIPYAAGYVFGMAETFFTETLPQKFGEIWDSISTFFTSTLPTWAQGVYESALSFFTETIPEFFGGLWESVSTFFTQTIPTWAESVFNAAVAFFTEDVPAFFGGIWSSVSTFMTETLPAWVEGVAAKASVFFGETVPAFFGNLWASISGFFTETLPAWADSAYQKAATFFGTTVPEFFGTLWSNVTTFVTQTLPEWAAGAFDKIAAFFTTDIPQFFSDLWTTVSTAVAGQVTEWANSIASMVSGWWSSISGWFSDLWDTISGAFGAGREAGRGAHAEGGIMYAPHTAQVAEDGPEAIIPLGGADRARGVTVWQQAGDILGVGSRDTGVNVNPVGSNDDGRTEMPPDGGQGGPQGGDSDDNAPVFVTTGTGGRGPQGAAEDSPINVPVNIEINPEIVIQGTEGMSPDDVVRILKERIRELVDDISDEMAERLARVFSNMPLRGGA